MQEAGGFGMHHTSLHGPRGDYLQCAATKVTEEERNCLLIELLDENRNLRMSLHKTQTVGNLKMCVSINGPILLIGSGTNPVDSNVFTPLNQLLGEIVERETKLEQGSAPDEDKSYSSKMTQKKEILEIKGGENPVDVKSDNEGDALTDLTRNIGEGEDVPPRAVTK